MREMRIECLATVAFGAHGLLLRIDPLTICVLRTDDHRARRTQHGQTMVLHHAVNSQLENIIAHDLRIVGRVVACRLALEFVERHALVCPHRQMTTEAARRP